MTGPARPRPAAAECGLGYCKALVTRRGATYCSPEHSQLAANRQTAEARGRRAVDAYYEQIARGEQDPIPHRGIFFSTNGVVLSGDVVQELRLLMQQYSRSQTELSRPARDRIAFPDLLNRYDEHLQATHAFLQRLAAVLPPITPNPPGGQSR